MKITVESATGTVGGVISSKHDIYLDGKIKGWLGLFGKLKIKNVEAGRHTITIVSDTKTNSRKKSIRFTATQDVCIWIREKTTIMGDRFETLTLGEDVKILEEIG